MAGSELNPHIRLRRDSPRGDVVIFLQLVLGTVIFLAACGGEVEGPGPGTDPEVRGIEEGKQRA